MWKELDPEEITNNVCMQCASCCKHTVRYNETTEVYARRKIEYLKAMYNKPIEDFKLLKVGNNGYQVHVTFKCAQLLPNNGCRIYEKRPYTCSRFNCFETSNINKRLPENYENIRKYIDREKNVD